MAFDYVNRDKEIMMLRYGLNNQKEYTQKEVADALGISQSYISRLEKRIIKKLKKQIPNIIFFLIFRLIISVKQDTELHQQ